MSHVPNQSQTSLFFLVAVSPSTSQTAGARRGFNCYRRCCSSTTILALSPSSAGCAALVATMWARRRYCPQGAHREKLSKSRSTTSSTSGPSPSRHSLPHQPRPPQACRCRSELLAYDFLHWRAGCADFVCLFFSFRRRLIVSAWRETSERERDIRMRCTGTFLYSRRGVFVCGLSPCAGVRFQPRSVASSCAMFHLSTQ
jgi:hypothetical protein